MLLDGKVALITGGESGLGRHTTPEEIAHAVLYLAGDSGAMVNSQQFSIDGGLSAM